MVRAVAIFQIGMVPWFFDMVDLQGADSRCLVGFHKRGPESQRSPSGRPVAAIGRHGDVQFIPGHFGAK